MTVDTVIRDFYDAAGNLVREEIDLGNDMTVDRVTRFFYSCNPLAIPTLAPTGLLLLIGLLGASALFVLSRRSPG